MLTAFSNPFLYRPRILHILPELLGYILSWPLIFVTIAKYEFRCAAIYAWVRYPSSVNFIEWQPFLDSRLWVCRWLVLCNIPSLNGEYYIASV